MKKGWFARVVLCTLSKEDLEHRVPNSVSFFSSTPISKHLKNSQVCFRATEMKVTDPAFKKFIVSWTNLNLLFEISTPSFWPRLKMFYYFNVPQIKPSHEVGLWTQSSKLA